jgi:cell shape-determining protein MreC
VEPIILIISSTKNVVANISPTTHIYFSSRNELVKQNASLMLTVEKLENEIAEKDSLIKEEYFIKSNSIQKMSSSIIMYPIMKDIIGIYSTVLLSKGFKNGVEENSLVFLRGRQPVCVIEQVYDKTSLCKLLSAPDVKTEGVVTSTSLVLPLTGIGGGAFISDVPRDTNINVGDIVYLASDQTMKLGTVTEVVHNNQETSLHVFIRGLYNPVTSSVFYINK